MQNSAGIVDFPLSPSSHACIVEVSQIHNLPTPTHHPANPVNSENTKYPTRENWRNPASSQHAGPGRQRWPERLLQQLTTLT